MDQIYHLRYQIYCRESFIRRNDFFDERERDEYDQHSQHFAAIRDDGVVFGTTRLILPHKYPPPFQSHCQGRFFSGFTLPCNSQLAEVSRFIICKEKKPKISPWFKTDQPGASGGFTAYSFIDQTRWFAWGLYDLMLQETRRRNLTHWFALMERGLWSLLNLYGIRFECIGHEVDVYGVVKPYVVDILKVEKTLGEFRLYN